MGGSSGDQDADTWAAAISDTGWEERVGDVFGCGGIWVWYGLG